MACEALESTSTKELLDKKNRMLAMIDTGTLPDGGTSASNLVAKIDAELAKRREASKEQKCVQPGSSRSGNRAGPFETQGPLPKRRPMNKDLTQPSKAPVKSQKVHPCSRSHQTGHGRRKRCSTDAFSFKPRAVRLQRAGDNQNCRGTHNSEKPGQVLPLSRICTRSMQLRISRGDAPSETVDLCDSDKEMDTPCDASETTAREVKKRKRSWGRKYFEEFLDLRALYPPQGGPGSVAVTAEDLQWVVRDEFINDTLIDLYIKHVEDNAHSTQQHFFRSFFYTKLVESEANQGVDLKKWTKDVDLFEKQFVFVPVHSSLHWSLAVICHPGAECTTKCKGQTQLPCILHLDSLQDGHSTAEVSGVLRRYLEGEWERKHPDSKKRIFSKQTIPGRRVDHIPRQINSYDCGLFMLTYLEFFSFGAPNIVDHRKLGLLGDGGFPGFLQEGWFKRRNASLLRSELQNFVHTLLAQQGDQCHPGMPSLRAKIEQYEQRKIRYASPEAWLRGQLTAPPTIDAVCKDLGNGCIAERDKDPPESTSTARKDDSYVVQCSSESNRKSDDGNRTKRRSDDRMHTAELGNKDYPGQSSCQGERGN
ncbi:unnamed protein product [Ostreobium quekettii]|uniref:Ubiquitin-like protease family profile domain-containing protein n=1 Tax=Ostreobium quekettii TaxID=121088 RepID=A0A8S1IL34_9CHLO|nr:unnamed protein product [Ostreobium quekettii]|eukprot:evm.model.scf_503.8 EVM.evm.TU.scf_503.8   scf_503:42111-49412(-)